MSGPEIQDEESKSILDVVNFALSLDLNGRMAVVDAQGRYGQLVFHNRRLQDVQLADLRGWEALKALSEGVRIEGDLDFSYGDEGQSGPLDLNYDDVVDFLSQYEKPAEPPPPQPKPKDMPDVKFPEMPKDLFKGDKNIVMFGMMAFGKVQARVIRPEGVPPNRIPVILRFMHQQLKASHQLTELIYGEEHRKKGVYTNMFEVPGYLAGVVGGDAAPIICFALSTKPAILGPSLILGNLEYLWKLASEGKRIVQDEDIDETIKKEV